MKSKPAQSIPVLPALVILLFAAITLFHLASAASGYPHFRDQHLGAALNFTRDGIDILRPVIPGFNASRSGTPQEPAIWQALASVVIRGMNGNWVGGNVLSLLCFAFGLWPLWKIASAYLGPRAAWWSLAAFLSQPLIVVTAGQASSDGLSLVFAIWFFFAAMMLVQTGRWRWFLPAVFFGSLAATAKLPLFMAAGLGSGLMLLVEQRHHPVRWLQLLLTGVVCAGIFFWWNRLATSVLLSAEYPHVKLWLADNPAMWRWYFGDWAFRLNPANWVKGGWAALNCLFGSFALAGLFVLGICQRRLQPAVYWLAGGIVTMMIFSHLVLVHRHYFVLFSPAVALLVGAALARIEETCLSAAAWSRYVCVPALGGVLLLGAVQGLIGMEVMLNYDPYGKRVAGIIRSHVGEEEKVLIQGGGWGGQLLMLSDRDGLTIFADDTLTDPAKVTDLRRRGYTKLVMVSESPLLWALKKTNPGAGALERESYRQHWAPEIDRWPTDYADEDLLIKRLPDL